MYYEQNHLNNKYKKLKKLSDKIIHAAFPEEFFPINNGNN